MEGISFNAGYPVSANSLGGCQMEDRGSRIGSRIWTMGGQKQCSLLQAILACREEGVAPAFPLESAQPWNLRCHTPILAWTQQMSHTGGGTAQSKARPHFVRCHTLDFPEPVEWHRTKWGRGLTLCGATPLNSTC